MTAIYRHESTANCWNGGEKEAKEDVNEWKITGKLRCN